MNFLKYASYCESSQWKYKKATIKRMIFFIQVKWLVIQAIILELVLYWELSTNKKRGKRKREKSVQRPPNWRRLQQFNCAELKCNRSDQRSHGSGYDFMIPPFDKWINNSSAHISYASSMYFIDRRRYKIIHLRNLTWAKLTWKPPLAGNCLLLLRIRHLLFPRFIYSLRCKMLNISIIQL